MLPAFLVVLLLGVLLPVSLVLAVEVTVTADAPDEVIAGSDFVVPLNINYVENFNACGVGVRFDPNILSLTGVTDGEINETTIPIVAFVEGDPGAVGVVANLGGSSAVTGSGYLMELHFSALAPGDSDINLVKCSMSDNDAQLIEATWVGDSVTVIAGESPTIAFEPTIFSFSATESGANPSNQTLDIWNSGGGTLNWSVSDDDGTWLSLDPASGSSTGEHDTVTLWVDISGLDAGDYNATITITAAGATNTPQTVPVSLTIDVSSGAIVNISVILQGGSRPDEGWVIPVTIQFFTPGANVMSDIPVYSSNQTTVKSDGTATANVTGIAPGTYDITVVSEHTLMNVRRGVVISTPSTAVDMGTLLEGDVNGDNIANISDISTVIPAYLKSEGEPGYNAMADFDRNGIVNIADISLIIPNYLKTSPVEVP